MRARRQRARAREHAASLPAAIFTNRDIVRLLLPMLSARTFVALRCTSAEIRDSTQQVCLELVELLERTASLYISPAFADALRVATEHEPHVAWLLQTPVLGIVAPERYHSIISNAYHLLQAKFSRVQKLAVSNSLRNAADIGKEGQRLSELSRCVLLHLSVRLGMFTESRDELRTLHALAKEALLGIEAHFAGQLERPTSASAVHYTLAGFFTYHYRRRDLGMARPLVGANHHLKQALEIQAQRLGPAHVSTLCSNLVKAQLLLLRDSTSSCSRLLERQLRFCQQLLSLDHPLAAKMLAVQARLHARLGNEGQCDELQRRVLAMRQAALGEAHEDTHRSAVDVYTRRRWRAKQLNPSNVSSVDEIMAWSSAMRTCLRMLCASVHQPDGPHGFVLSKSLQAMSTTIRYDIDTLLPLALWSQEETVELLQCAADTFERLPLPPDDSRDETPREAALRYRRLSALIREVDEWNRGGALRLLSAASGEAGAPAGALLFFT